VTTVFNRRDIGYTVISRYEEAFRQFLSENLLVNHQVYQDGIPQAVIDKARDRSVKDQWEDVSDFLEDTDFPDLKEITCYRKRYKEYFPQAYISQTEFEQIHDKLYHLRNKIAHVKQHFGVFDLDKLLDGTRSIARQLGGSGSEYIEWTNQLEQDSDVIILPMPAAFSELYKEPAGIPNNVPVPDYEFEGGFVGRTEDVRKIIALLEGPRNVITISGAGGVGKTALALRILQILLQRPAPPFDTIVWLSAKETKLSYLGIEDIEPSIKNYEELLDTIFEVLGFDNPSNLVEQKEEDIRTVFQLYNQSLIVIDNLETITDDRITNFILDVEENFPKVKVLVTSRKGLGQVERRHELQQLKVTEATNLFRRIARDKKLTKLAQMEDGVLENYVNRVACYPLAIKWVVGQVAIGKNLTDVIGAINETTSDISKFSFEQVFDALSPIAKKILCALSVFDDPPSAGVLNFIVDSSKETFEDGLQELILVSLVVPEQYKTEKNEIASRFTLLSLTRGYVRHQLDRDQPLKREILDKRSRVQSTIDEAEHAKKQYRYSLSNFGADSEEERVAAMLAQTAFQKYQAGRYLDAVEEYKRAVRIAPQFASVYRNWAVMEAQEQHSVEAEQLLIKASRLDPEDVQIWLIWGNIKRKESKINEALEYYEKAYTLSPDDSVVLNSFGQAKSRAGNFKEADRLFKKALGTRNTTSPIQNEIINHSSIARNLQRWAESERRSRKDDSAIAKVEEALEHCYTIIELDANDSRSQELLRKNLIELGFLYINRDPEQALIHFKKAIIKKSNRSMKHKEAKNNLEASVQAGKILLQLRRIEEAKQVFPEKMRAEYPGPQRQNPRLKQAVDELWQLLYGTSEVQKERCSGSIKWFNRTKGYGFIQRNNDKDIFMHISNLRDEDYVDIIQPGTLVNFIVEIPIGRRKVQAVDVVVQNPKLSKT